MSRRRAHEASGTARPGRNRRFSVLRGSARRPPWATPTEPAAAAQSSTAGGGAAAARQAPFRQFFAIVDVAADVVLAAALLGEVAIVLGNVGGRACCGYSLPWLEEVTQLLMLAMMVVAGAVAYKRGYCASVEALLQALPPAWRRGLNGVAELTVLLTGVAVAITGVQLALEQWSAITASLGIHETFILIPLPVGAALFALYAAERLAAMAPRDVLRAVAGLLPVAAVLALAALTIGPSLDTATVLLVLALVFVAQVLIGVPVAVVLVNIPLCYLFLTASAPIGTVPVQMFDTTGNFVLVAIPLFVLAGIIMAVGGIGRRIGDFVKLMVGPIPGGPLHSIIVSMYVFSGLSGSKSADMAAVGTAMSDSVAEQGYRKGEIGAVLGASAVMGETIPPSTAMLVLASVTSVSTAALFLAGLVPAAVLGICLMLVVYLTARRSADGRSGRWPGLGAIAMAAFRGIPAFLLPAILLFGILLALATPTEISAIAVLYAILIVAVTAKLSRARAVTILRQTTGICGMVLFTVGGATAFAWFLTVTLVPQGLATLVTSAGSGLMFMAATIVFGIVLGLLLEGLPALIILAPILVPVATTVGINPLQYSIVLILSQGIGSFIPPVGVGAYVTCGIAKVRMEELTFPLLRYLVVIVAGVVLVAAVPVFSTWLPGLLVHTAPH